MGGNASAQDEEGRRADPEQPPSIRLRIDFAYDGREFAGWAAQPGLRTVEQTLTDAWSTILRVGPVKLTTAGRTDAGVHALAAVCHADVSPDAYAALPGRSTRSPEQAAQARLSGVLPPDVVVHAVRVAPPGFDARFSAAWRRYAYRICDQQDRRNPLRRHDTLWWPRPLDLEMLNAAGAELLGLRDFGAFCRRREGATTIRHLMDFGWHRDDDGTLVAQVRADAFCHSMVRALVGAVVAVGEHRRDLNWLTQVRDSAIRNSTVTVLPAHGLTLIEVAYPEDDQLAGRAVIARSRRA